ncbi:hypothetical protein [Romboutsia ilealis]|uniref:hypothetical protein n=1 Tax=Romboutsia ilealis TaxID=1115758 RepID=UPI0025B74565|nr:hypothetical protein [Romboutsia ilealis]
MLTPKQEAFVIALVEGKSQRQAYKEAYPKTRMKDSTIDVEASKMFNNPKISIRYQELLDEFKQKALYSREEAVKDLVWVKEEAATSIRKKGLNQGNGTIYINSVKELCALNDLYPDKKAKDDDKQEKDIAKALKEALGDL